MNLKQAIEKGVAIHESGNFKIDRTGPEPLMFYQEKAFDYAEKEEFWDPKALEEIMQKWPKDGWKDD